MTLNIKIQSKTEFTITLKCDTRHETQENGIQHYNKKLNAQQNTHLNDTKHYEIQNNI